MGTGRFTHASIADADPVSGEARLGIRKRSPAYPPTGHRFRSSPDAGVPKRSPQAVARDEEQPSRGMEARASGHVDIAWSLWLIALGVKSSA
jgi:hypothetical protein